MKNIKIAFFALTAVVALMTLFIRVPLPSRGYFNFGDVAVVFSGLVLGSMTRKRSFWWGAGAGGIGSAPFPALIASLARKAVAQLETRVSVTEVLAMPDPDDPSLVHIEIRYRLLHSPVPRELGLSLDLGTLPVGPGRASAGQGRAG